MTNRRRETGRRVMTVVALVTSGAIALAGCGGGDGDKKPDNASMSKSGVPKGGGPSSGSATPSAEPTQVLAQIKGEENMVVTLNSATRDAGGFVTVQGTITNNGDKPFTAVSWRGQEVALVKSGPSVAGAVLVDQAGKKRYYILRDTEGKCLCTMGLTLVPAKETRPFFAQFPAPPTATTSVEFQLPTMPPAKIQISEG
ncbi:hypothetical protein [Streptomyces sp. RKAG337]|uniref:hypothetical protein n=1 Tax=Streptomyces sp. RKAG337 TaxID=2893404 RepID=UPI002033E748|nr:hypothetical protein [Streptomyces sp. RKAG337]MCM2426474.1 hypothetical protein [Streptomyces sp. RKAG337]